MPTEWRAMQDLSPTIRKGMVRELPAAAAQAVAEQCGLETYEAWCPTDVPEHYSERQARKERERRERERDAEVKSLWSAIRSYLQ